MFKLGEDYIFPHPSNADKHGIVAYGGDLNPLRILEAYKSGIFPWFESDQNPQWSPFWVMPYVGSPSGQTWIVAGHSLTQNIEGEEVTVVQMIDAQIENGLIKWAIIYEKQSPINQN